MRRLTILFTTVFALFAAGAMAQGEYGKEHEDSKAKSFDELDRNGNGVLEENEVSAVREGDLGTVAFDQLDQDDDGQVSRSEYSRYFR